MYWLTRLSAVLLLAVAALLAATPWGFADHHRMVGPLAVAALIIAVVSQHPDAMPTWGVALVGIVFDCLTLAPIGFWTLVWLVAVAAGCAVASLGGGRLLSRAGSMAAVAGVATFYWAEQSLYQWHIADWLPIAWAGLWTALLLIVAMLLMDWLARGHTSRASLRLERSLR